MQKYDKVLGFIDIGANLTDSMFSGIYNGSTKHIPDLQHVLKRSWDVGVKKIIITGTDLTASKSAIELAESDSRLYSTVGCHPTCCSEFEKSGDPASYLQSLVQLCKDNIKKVAAIGEFGLDYDRLHFTPKTIQLKYFEEQLKAFEEIQLPLFLHCRNAYEDLTEILSRHKDKLVGGVVHSFDGSEEQANAILDLGLCIGINGCSLKTESNVSVVKRLPSNRLLIETDSPWCEIRPTHHSFQYLKSKYPSVKKEKWQEDKMIKGRNEPCNIIHILEALAAARGEDICDLGNTIYDNTEKLFFSNC